MLQPPFSLPSKIRMLWVIRFHPSHRLFSRLRNHSTVSLTIPLGNQVFFGAYFEQFSLSSPDVNKKQSSGWDSSFNILPLQVHRGIFVLLSLECYWLYGKNIRRSRRHPAEFQPITARVLCTSHFIVRLNPLSERFFGKKYCKANSPGESTRYSLALDFFRPGKEIKHDLIVTSINGCLKIIDVAMKPFYIIIHFNIICKFSVFVPKTKSEMK